MRFRFLLVVLLLLTTACSSPEEGATLPETDPAPTEVAKKSQPVKPAEAVAPAITAATEFKLLNEQYALAAKEFSKLTRSAKTRAAYNELLKKSPLVELGPKFIELVKKYPESEEANAAMNLLITRGQPGDTKTEAMTMLLARVDANPDDPKNMRTLKLVASQSGTDGPIVEAMSRLLKTAESDLGSAASIDTLSLLAFSRNAGAAKAEANSKLRELIDSQPGTDAAASALALFATKGNGKSKSDAIDQMVESYVDNNKIIGVLAMMPRSPSLQSEKSLEQVIANTTNPKVKGNALVAKLELINRVNSNKERYDGASEDLLARIPKKALEYYTADRDENELSELQADLEEFVSTHPDAVKKIERELFSLKNLRVNCVAPNISGRDLDDKEFDLTDYRGKVVLLDFWGDW